MHNIDATFENGKTSLIIGQSGSGKTVLMKCIVGLLTPEKGEVLYDGRNFLAMAKMKLFNCSLVDVKMSSFVPSDLLRKVKDVEIQNLEG